MWSPRMNAEVFVGFCPSTTVKLISHNFRHLPLRSLETGPGHCARLARSHFCWNVPGSFPSTCWAIPAAFTWLSFPPGLMLLTQSSVRLSPALSSSASCLLFARGWTCHHQACRWLLFAAVSSTHNTVLGLGLKPVCSCPMTQEVSGPRTIFWVLQVFLRGTVMPAVV